MSQKWESMASPSSSSCSTTTLPIHSTVRAGRLSANQRLPIDPSVAFVAIGYIHGLYIHRVCVASTTHGIQKGPNPIILTPSTHTLLSLFLSLLPIYIYIYDFGVHLYIYMESKYQVVDWWCRVPVAVHGLSSSSPVFGIYIRERGGNIF